MQSLKRYDDSNIPISKVSSPDGPFKYIVQFRYLKLDSGQIAPKFNVMGNLCRYFLWLEKIVALALYLSIHFFYLSIYFAIYICYLSIYFAISFLSPLVRENSCISLAIFLSLFAIFLSIFAIFLSILPSIFDIFLSILPSLIFFLQLKKILDFLSLYIYISTIFLSIFAIFLSILPSLIFFLWLEKMLHQSLLS